MLNGGYYLCLLTIDFILNIYNHRSTINGLSMVSSSDPITTSVPSPRTSRCRHSHWPQRRALNRWPSGALSTGVCHGRWGGNIPWVCHGWPENWKISNGVYHVLPEICGKISGEELRTCFFSSKNIWKHMKTTKNPMVKSWEHIEMRQIGVVRDTFKHMHLQYFGCKWVYTCLYWIKKGNLPQCEVLRRVLLRFIRRSEIPLKAASKSQNSSEQLQLPGP